MTVRIVVGDCRELGRDVADRSVDMIFTDPPYRTEYLHLYDWLFEFAVRALKPDGFLMTYIGNTHQDLIMAKARMVLEHYWTFWYLNGSGASSVVWDRMVISRAKPLLCYRLPGSHAKPRTMVLGAWTGCGADKRYHVWGQDESTARYYIDCFTKPGGLVLDPFCGGGTTPYVCTVLRRDCLAFEIDPVIAAIAIERQSAVQPLLFDPREQLEMGL